MPISQQVLESAQTIDYPHELYHSEAAAEGIQGGFGAVTEAHLQQFHEQGFLVVHRAFAPEEIDAAMQGLVHLMDGGNPDFRGRQFEPRLAKYRHNLTVEEQRDTIRKLFSFVDYEPRLKALCEHAALLQTLARLMGESPLLFQDMALCKPPWIGSEKPWHQDCAYFNLPSDTVVVGAWIALDSTTPENGCMHITPGSHQLGPTVHFKRRDWQICDTDVAGGRTLAVSLEPGGCLLFHGLLHHGTPMNRSGQRRRALQFHYKPANAGKISTQERMAAFGSEGKGVEC